MKIHDVRQHINCDSELLTILRHLPPVDFDGPWVAGGSVWKSIECRPLDSDVDFFFKSAEQCERWFRTLLSMPYVHRIVSEPKANDYNTSLSYHIHSRNFNKTVKIQLISFAFFKDVEELFNGFDFTACQFAFDGEILYSGDTSFDDLRNRDIVFNNIRDNYATAIHLEKYLKHGFKAPDSQKQKFDEIMALRKPKYEEKATTYNYLYSYSSPSVSEPPINPPVRESYDEDSGYPRPANIDNNQGINLVRATQAPRRPTRQEQRASLWDDSPAERPWSPPIQMVTGQASGIVASYATTTIDSTMYVTNTMTAGESMSSPEQNRQQDSGLSPLAVPSSAVYYSDIVTTPTANPSTP